MCSGAQGVEARRDQGLHRVRQRQVGRARQVAVRFEQPPVGEQAHELLGVQGVAARTFQEQRLHLRRQHRLPEQGGEQHRGLRVVEGGQGHGRRIRLPGPPAGAPVEQLRPGRDHHEQIGRARLVEQLLEEVEQGRVGPVQVLDHQDQGPLCRHQLEEAPPRHERLVPAGRRLGGGREPHQRREPRLEPLALRGVAGDGADRRVQLGGSLPRVVGLQDARLGLDDLAEGPEADGLAVGEAVAPAPGDQLRSGVERSRRARATSRLLPTPGSPRTVTSCTACSLNACR